MVDSRHLAPVSATELERPARRLLKTWHDAELVRRMDEIIIASRGAYADRSEFLTEAIRDRIEAEEERLNQGSDDLGAPAATAAPIPRAGVAVDGGASLFTPTLPLEVTPGDWLHRRAPTLPLSPGPATNFGLHNRDWPTLLAADWLGRLTSEAGEPLDWEHFTTAVLAWAWDYGAKLQSDDLDRPRGAKLAAGFPTNRKKREATEARFIEHFLGAIDRRGNRGPLFVFGLVGLDERRAALTRPGVELLRRLRAAEIATGPPFSPAAWEAFAAHLRERAPRELETWLRVLRVVQERPDRETLVRSCSWWKGATADTNSMSLIARGREWGLVEIALDDGGYELTEFGTATLRAEQRKGNVPS